MFCVNHFDFLDFYVDLLILAVLRRRPACKAHLNRSFVPHFFGLFRLI